MNPSVLSRPAIAAALFVASGTLAFADTATTDPVGFFTKALAASGGSTRVSSAVSFPLYRPPVYTAAATSVTDGSPTSTCQVNGFNAGTTDVITNPHLLRVKAATDTSHVGRFFLITAASGDQLTLSTTTLSASLSIGDTCEVLPANTLASVFGNPPVAGWQQGASANSADNIYVWSGTGWLTYFYSNSSGSWLQSGSFGPKNNTILYPDEGVFIARLGTSPISLVTTGTVPTTTERTDMNAAGSTFMSNRFPVDTQIGAIGIQSTTGWVSGSSANTADKVLVWNGTGWLTYFYNGTNWKKSGFFGNFDTDVIAAGTSIFVTRASATATTLVQSLPYTP